MAPLPSTGKGIGNGNKVYGYTAKFKIKKGGITLIEAIILSALLSVEPAFQNQTYEAETRLERKRSHKRRRKIRKPIKGLR